MKELEAAIACNTARDNCLQAESVPMIIQMTQAATRLETMVIEAIGAMKNEERLNDFMKRAHLSSYRAFKPMKGVGCGTSTNLLSFLAFLARVYGFAKRIPQSLPSTSRLQKQE